MGDAAESMRIWVIKLPGVGIIEGTHANERQRCVANFVAWITREYRAADGNPSSWKHLSASGYRCIRARLVLEE